MGLIKWWKDYLETNRKINEKYQASYDSIFEAPTDELYKMRLEAWNYIHRITRN